MLVLGPDRTAARCSPAGPVNRSFQWKGTRLRWPSLAHREAVPTQGNANSLRWVEALGEGHGLGGACAVRAREPLGREDAAREAALHSAPASETLGEDVIATRAISRMLFFT
ncbi:unnamed protein product [Lampetra planeri]